MLDTATNSVSYSASYSLHITHILCYFSLTTGVTTQSKAILKDLFVEMNLVVEIQYKTIQIYKSVSHIL